MRSKSAAAAAAATRYDQCQQRSSLHLKNARHGDFSTNSRRFVVSPNRPHETNRQISLLRHSSFVLLSLSLSLSLSVYFHISLKSHNLTELERSHCVYSSTRHISQKNSYWSKAVQLCISVCLQFYSVHHLSTPYVITPLSNSNQNTLLSINSRYCRSVIILSACNQSSSCALTKYYTNSNNNN